MQTSYKGLHSSPTNIWNVSVCVCTHVHVKSATVAYNVEFYGSSHCVSQAKVYTNLKQVRDEEKGKVSM